jgi:hypothetical protein
MANKALAVQNAQKLQQGLKKHFAKVKAITFSGEDHKPADISDTLQTVIDAAADTETKRAAYHAAVSTHTKAAATAQPLVLGLTSYVYLTYGTSNEVLADFGLPPRKKRKPTVETLAGAHKKAAATREARGTKGNVVASTPAAPKVAAGGS